ncbi:MAG: ROK family protein [Phycisphaeraceae bacterium]|nr:ROK family protein [Phycisphaeraceae bacterium]
MGLDLGGTQIKAGLLDPSSSVISSATDPTPTDSRPEVVIEAMSAMARRVVEEAGRSWQDVQGIGIGIPGLIDSRTGIVRACVNLKGWKDVELRELAGESLGRRVVVDNDANAAAFGEYSIALKRNTGLHHLALVTLGTGVGSGIVLNRRVFHGGGGLAGEVGHMIVEPNGHLCACGQYGCLEQYASATAVVRQATELMAAGKSSTLKARVDAGTLTTQDVFSAASEGDLVAERLIDDLASYLAIACVNLCRVIDLQAIVIGGGVAGAGDGLIRPLRKAFSRQNWGVGGGIMPKLSATELGNDAGFVGAAALAMAGLGDGQRG